MNDFGLSKYVNQSGLAHPDKFYSLHVPPETFEFGKSSFYIYIYQAGIALYRMCNANKYLREQFFSLNFSTRGQLAEKIIYNKFPKKDAFLPISLINFNKLLKKLMQ